MNKLSENLKYLRKLKNKSQREIAKELNISHGTWGNYESGTREPSIDSLIKICDYFDVSLDFIVGRENY